MFQMSTLSQSSDYNNNNKDKCSRVFQTIGIDKTTRCHDPEENNTVIDRSENLKAYNQIRCLIDRICFLFCLCYRRGHSESPRKNWKTSRSVSGGGNTG